MENKKIEEVKEDEVVQEEVSKEDSSKNPVKENMDNGLKDKQNKQDKVENPTETPTEDANKEDVKPLDTGKKETESNDALATRKFAEGAKKKEKEIFAACGVSSIDELVNLINQSKEQAKNYDELAAKAICTDLNVKKQYREDVIAIAKGKGLEITEENVRSVIESHPEWVVDEKENKTNVFSLGKTGGSSQPQDKQEREYVRNIFK